jgi:peptidoglycan/LPS O-acetylase OafA/YrhL
MDSGSSLAELRRTVRLSDAESGRWNNLNLIRLILAVLVILSHSYVLLGMYQLYEPMRRFLHFMDLGGTAVIGFFLISGYLITKSGLRMKTPQEFLKARFLRIFPGLFCAVLLCAFVLGPSVTTLPLGSYFSSPLFPNFLSEAVLHSNLGRLPGVFETRFSPEVDGSLWTLPGEWVAYIAVFLCCLAFRWRSISKKFTPVSFVFTGIAFILTLQMLPALGLRNSIPWFCFFALGALCYLFRTRILLNLPLALSGFALFLILIRLVPIAGKCVFPFALSYLILVLGYHPAMHFKAFHRLGDYSYGVYIYAWPIQQLFAANSQGQPLKNFLQSLPLIFVAAILSWHFLEAPCLRLKDGPLPKAQMGSGEPIPS